MQCNNLYLAITDLVNTTDNRQQALNIIGAVRNNQYIGGRIGSKMALLGHQWPQDRDQLGSSNIIDLHHPGNHLIATTGTAITGSRDSVLLGVDIRHDLDDFTAGDCSKTMHLEDRQKYLVDLLTAHGPRGNHGDLALYPRVDNEILVGHLGHRFNQGADIGIFQVKRHRLGMCLCTQHQLN